MKEIIWVDVLIPENFFMNYLLLYIINRFCKYGVKWWRISIAAFVGSLYVLIFFFPGLYELASPVIKLMVSLVMIIIAFFPYTLKDFIKTFILFYLEAFIIGGGIFACFYLSNREIESLNGAFMIDNVSPWHIIIGSLIAILLVKLGFDFFENYYSAEKNRIDMDIFLDKKSCSIKALIDTGNSLRDPITNSPVLVVYVKALSDILPEELVNMVFRTRERTDITKNFSEFNLKKRIRLIPFKALGTDNGLLVGIRVDMVIVKHKSKVKVLNDAVVALYASPISNKNEYDALAYPEILK